MKFNFVIGNPPYEGRAFLYTKILNAAWNQSSGLVWLCPTTFVDDVYHRNQTFNGIIKRYKDCINKFEDVDPRGFDMLVAQESLGVFFFSRNSKPTVDMENLAWRKYPEETKDICKKIVEYCQKKSLRKTRLAPKKIIGTAPQPDPNFKCRPDSWYVGCSWVRGTINDWTWITLLGNKDLPIKGTVKDTWFHVWEFDTEETAKQFCNYLNCSDILKFSVMMEKKNQTNNPGDFEYFPNSDLPWNEELLAENMKIDKKNLDFIKKTVQNYGN